MRWPLIAAIHGKQVRMSLAQQLRDAGLDVSEEQANGWADADGALSETDAPPKSDTAADVIFPMVTSAHSGHMAHALATARKATAATIPTAVVPLLARAAGWFARVLTALGDPAAPSLRHELPMSTDLAASEAFAEGWHAELVRHRELAMASYVRALRTDPGFHRARLRYAWVLFTEDRADAALSELSRLLESTPALSPARLMRATINVELGAKGAIAAAALPSRVAPDLDAVDQDTAADRAVSRLLRSRASLIAGQVPTAIKTARHSIALEPSRPEPYHALGLALTEAREFEAAAWAHSAALMAHHDFLVAGEAMFNLRQIPKLESAVPHARALIDQTWQ
jgi:tetratricopeptide (TPR) repeat protein